MRSVGIPLPPPFKGQNDQVPTFSLENPFCVELRNFQNKPGIVALRKGNKKYAQMTTDNPVAKALASYGDKLFALVVTDTGAVWYDVSTGTPSVAYSVALDSISDAQTLYFNGYLFWFGDLDLAPAPTGVGPRFYNGTTWGTAGYTWSISRPFGGAVYKNRAYFLNLNSSEYAYSNIDAISGATTKVDLGTVISKKGRLFAIKSLSLSENVTQENILAFAFETGEILVYSGSYPNSESWRLIARLQVAPIISVRANVDVKGDTFLFTTSEILSLRNIISKGYSVEQREGIGAAIENRWKQIISTIKTRPNPDIDMSYIRGVYDEDQDRLVITFPYYVDRVTGQVQTGLFQLIYDFGLNAWCEFFQPQSVPTGTEFWSIAAAYWSNRIFVLSDRFTAPTTGVTTVHTIDTETNYLDDDVISGEQGIQYKLTSAPHPLNRYGVVKTDGLEVIMKSDIYSTAKWRLIGDLGAQQTAEQATSGNGTNVTKTFVNLGIESNLVQYQVSGTSAASTVGLEIYGTNLWVNPSQGVAR